ncbi:hypothetical protein NF556_18890 [Ornithinimicrobium faecis]|uniref:Secretion/DNA translocation related CpaE-like protein n=1 Tax=Ornithinimicrobium faecis TaxID=2934158 RepID=A0ABY4YU04_9MICO|nr:septum site-determining protein Ssd [Ornithinimicrobium sp. HY1793]USQ79632.1 hypothetical protein NF556_18890 [Ornithinimicrobium sp. HY1793]
MTVRQEVVVTPAGEGFVLGVLGASGGVGASVLAAACAVRAAAARRDVALIDGHPWSGGLDVLAGMDLVPGLRWPQLRDIRGDVDPQRLVGELPASAAGVRCLSWGADTPAEPTGPQPVLSAVRAAVEITVLDLPRPGVPVTGHQRWWSACDELVLVLDASVAGIGAAAATAKHLEESTGQALAGLVVRSPTPLSDQTLAEILDAPVLVRLGEDRSVSVCLERGAAVGSDSGPLAEAADEVLSRVLPMVRAA